MLLTFGDIYYCYNKVLCSSRSYPVVAHRNIAKKTKENYKEFGHSWDAIILSYLNQKEKNAFAFYHTIWIIDPIFKGRCLRSIYSMPIFEFSMCGDGLTSLQSYQNSLLNKILIAKIFGPIPLIRIFLLTIILIGCHCGKCAEIFSMYIYKARNKLRVEFELKI